MACTSILRLEAGVQGGSHAGWRRVASTRRLFAGDAHRLGVSSLRAARPCRPPLQVQAFKFLKQLGLKARVCRRRLAVCSPAAWWRAARG